MIKNIDLMCVISNLKPIYKEVILMFYYLGLDTNQIAEAINCTQNTVNVRLNRARLKLKNDLMEE